MHAIRILQRCLSPLLKHIHARRLATLLEAVASCVSGPALSLTDVGRRFAGEALLRHKIKRADRLLGNRRLQQEARSVYAALCRVTLARIGEPVILIDWSDLKADQSLHLLRALFVLVLIASLAAILLWLIGTAAERTGLHERLRPCSGKRRAYSRLFLARLLLTVEHCKAAATDWAMQLCRSMTTLQFSRTLCPAGRAG